MSTTTSLLKYLFKTVVCVQFLWTIELTGIELVPLKSEERMKEVNEKRAFILHEKPNHLETISRIDFLFFHPQEFLKTNLVWPDWCSTSMAIGSPPTQPTLFTRKPSIQTTASSQSSEYAFPGLLSSTINLSFAHTQARTRTQLNL